MRLIVLVFLHSIQGAVRGLISSPEFVLEPPSRTYVSDASGLTIRCAALGTPLPTITWVNGGARPITSVPGVREILANGSLWLGGNVPPDQQSRGTLRCRARNLAGTVLSRSTSFVIVSKKEMLPKVEVAPTPVGGMATLKCRIDTPEAFEVSWTMQKARLESPIPVPDAGRFVYGHLGNLYIMGVSPEDSTTRFQCRISSKGQSGTAYPKDLTTVSHSSDITSEPGQITVLDAIESGTAPRIDTSHHQTLQITDGTPFTIPCLASANPSPKFSWTRDGHSSSLQITTLSNAIGINMPSSSELWARGPILGSGRSKASHAGTYTCVAANSKGSDRTNFELKVLQELRVIVLPQQQTVSSGGRAVIRCTVYGSPVAEVRWYKDGLVLEPNSHLLVQGREVIVSGTSERDVGVYQCIAANSLGDAQAASYLTIRESVPELTHKFIEQTLQPGPAVTLTCSGLGHPSPSITWTRDGQPLTTQNGPYSTSRTSVGSWIDANGQVVGQVNISSATMMDGGLYQCEASNRVGRVIHQARLNIYGPPTTRQPANMTAISKREVILPCPLAGYPLMDIQWMLDSRPVTPTLRRYPKGDGTLHIGEVDASQDSKRYSCTASNSQGLYATASFFLNVLNPPVLAEIKFPDNLFEGMRLSVLCTLLEGDVPISIRWSREDGVQLPDDPTVSQSHAHFYSNLVFTKVQGRHAGRYTCIASNTAASTSVSAEMKVKVPPSWIVEPLDLQVVSGEDFSLECHSSGTPMPSVTWRRQQGDLSLSESPEVTSDGWRVTQPRQGSLRIRSARPEDGGSYICHSQNGVTPALSKVIKVDVLEGATIEGRVSNETIGVGGTLKLRCEGRGHQPILFTWTRNGNPIRASPVSAGVGLSIHEEEGGTVSVVTLNSATRDQAAVYTCQAANAYGAAIKTFFVSVVEHPDPPAHVHVVRVTSRELSLAWAPPFDGNSPLTHYLLQTWRVQNGRPGTPKNRTISADETNYEIQDLIPGTQYHVQVLAVNEMGASLPSPTLSITTHMEPPSASPLSVTAVPSKKGVLTISWKPPPEEPNLTGYQVGFRIDRSAEDYAWRSVRSSTLSTELRGLSYFTTYVISVRGVNDVGTGPLSPPIKATTSQAEPTAFPENIDCTALSSKALRVRWNAIPRNQSHGPIHGYKVFFKKLLPKSNDLGSDRMEIKQTTNLETNLQDLQQYTNYSISVLAFNSAGDGKLSQPIICSTLQDKPGPPRMIKALISGPNSVTVSWTHPMQPNGVLTHYNLYYRPLNAHLGTLSLVVDSSSSFAWEEISKEVAGLDAHSHYEFWVRGSTRIGEGTSSNVVAQSPRETVPAQIMSFGQRVEGVEGQLLILPCNVIGYPPPSVEWTPSVQILPDHSLRFPSLQTYHEKNYTCRATNTHGRDEAIWVVDVVSSPLSPTVHVQFTTENSIHLMWTTRSKGKKPVTMYVIRYKEHVSDNAESLPDEKWHEKEVDPTETRYVLQDMKCGTTYHIQILAVNSVGIGLPSPTVTTRTRGTEPQTPRSQDLITVNSSAITLHFYTWPTGGCPISYFIVAHIEQGMRFPSPTRLPENTDTFTLRDLSSLTWYEVKITAYNSAGSATVSYQIATPSQTGATLAPELVVEVQQVGIKVPAYLDPHVLAPVVSGIACTLALLLCVAIAISRGAWFSKKWRDKESPRDPREPRALLFFRKSLGPRNESCETLSPAARAKHEEAYGVEDSSFEICPYATFSPHKDTPFPGPPSGFGRRGETLDYSLHFQTFGHQECLEGGATTSPGGAQSTSSSSSGWLFLKGRQRTNNERKRRSGGEIRCLSNDQTLPIGSALPRVIQQQLRSPTTPDAGSDSDDPDDTSENPLQYRIPIKLKRGSDFSFHPPDSSTESNEDRSPHAPRRPSLKLQLSKAQRNNHQPRRPQSQHFPPAAPSSVSNRSRRSNTMESIYSVDGNLNSAVSTPLRPPSGFTDSREFSEAECDREQKRVEGEGKSSTRGKRNRHGLTPQEGPADYTIHV